MAIDRYRKKLQHASWTWREDHSWCQGKFLKERRYGRNDKRSARQADRKEIEQDTDLATSKCVDGVCECPGDLE